MVLLKDIKFRKITKENSKVENSWIRECEICKEQFLVKKARRDSARFCSYKCRGIAQKRKIWNIRPRNYVKFECKNCGKIFARTKRRYGTKTNLKKPQFCSQTCYFEFGRGKPRGSKSEGYKRMTEARHGKCIICNFVRFVEIAHILPRSTSGTFKQENILFLCPNHHRLFDSNKLIFDEERKIQHQILTALKNINLRDIHTARFRKFFEHWGKILERTTLP